MESQMKPSAFMIPHPKILILWRHFQDQALGKFLFVYLLKALSHFLYQHISHGLIGCSALLFINSLHYLG